MRRRAAPDPQLGVAAAPPASRARATAPWTPDAEDRDLPGVRPGEELRRDRRDGGRADLGDRRRVQDRHGAPGLAVVEEHRALVRVEPARGVGRRDDDLLEREDRRRRRRGGRASAPSSWLVGGRNDERSGMDSSSRASAARASSIAAMHDSMSRSSRTSCVRQHEHAHREQPLAVASRSSLARWMPSASRTGASCSTLFGPTTTAVISGHVQEPGDREPGHRDAALCRLALERLERVERRVGPVLLAALGPHRHARAGRAAARRDGTCRSATRRRVG